MSRVRRVNRVLVLVVGLIWIASLAYGAWSLEGFVLTDDSIVSYEAEIYEAGVIDRVEADGIRGFTIFRITREKKEPVLTISDFSEARGKQLSAGMYWVAPELSGGVPEAKVLAELGTIEDKQVKAFVRIYILSPSEAELEGLSVGEEE